MGLDYALVHLKYTIPPAVLLTLLYRPLFTKIDVYKICFLITIAVLSTIPWDSYLIRSRIWTYPPNAVLGPVLFRIPVEELFFFFIQTYDVSLLYLILSRPTFHPACLRTEKRHTQHTTFVQQHERFLGIAGQVFLLTTLAKGAHLVYSGGLGTYLGLIIIWAFPFLLLLWSLSNQFLLRLPQSNTVIPIVIPTLYLWLVDTFALRRGTWVIENGTKYGLHLWEGLDIEEAFFFLTTNCLVVFGLIAFDNTVAIFDTFPDLFPLASPYFSPSTAIRALTLPTTTHDDKRVLGMAQAIARLRNKSRSFYLASAVFTGRLRIELVLLYSFCRVADDLVDGASNNEDARKWIDRLRKFVDLAFSSSERADDRRAVLTFVEVNFSTEVQLALLQLPLSHLSKKPLVDLLRGFEIDLCFSEKSTGSRDINWPITTEGDLEQYASYVAGTVAELCIDLVLHHGSAAVPTERRQQLKAAGHKMGIALQLVNISRDIKVDADIGRVYIPLAWLKDEGLDPEAVLKSPLRPEIDRLRTRLLDKAFLFYEDSRAAIEELPVNARGPMRVAVESYMEIGRVLREGNHLIKAGRATVPVSRRLMVAWKTLNK